jgi:hypothetical protein
MVPSAPPLVGERIAMDVAPLSARQPEVITG